MLRIHTVLAIGALGAVLALGCACSGTDKDETGETGLTTQPDNLSDCDASDGVGVEINSASITGDTLTVSVSYGGGCEEHLFSLCWPDLAVMESEPVQVNLEIWHGGPPDMCDAYLTEDIAFDLTPLQSAVGTTSGTVLVNLGTDQLTYSF